MKKYIHKKAIVDVVKIDFDYLKSRIFGGERYTHGLRYSSSSYNKEKGEINYWSGFVDIYNAAEIRVKMNDYLIIHNDIVFNVLSENELNSLYKPLEENIIFKTKIKKS